MRRTMTKLLALALALALTLALSGCNLVDVDQVELAAQEREQVAETLSTVVAEYDGGTVTALDVMPDFYNSYTYMSQIYASMGVELDDATANSILEDAVAAVLQDRAIAKEFEARGLTLDKTEEEIRAEADEAYQTNLDYALDYAAGDSEEARAANAELILFTQGYTPEYMYEMFASGYRAEVLEADVEAEIAEVSDEELQAAYDEKTAADEETYSETPTQFETDAMNGATICWRPEGYRAVKHVLIVPEDDVLQAVTDAREALDAAQDELADLEEELASATDDDAEAGEEARSEAEIQADIDAKRAELEPLEQAVTDAEAACLASVADRTDAVYEKLAAGEDFDAVMAEYGEDPGMQSEPNMTTGYYVCAASTAWDPDFTAGAMALANVGDYSQTPVISTSGVHIIEYYADVPSGAVPLDEVRDALYDETLEEMREAHYTEQLDAWVAALNPVYHLDAWTSVGGEA